MASRFFSRWGRTRAPRSSPAPGASHHSLLATVSVLNALQPVAEALRTVMPGGAPAGIAPDWSDADSRLARDGRLAVFEGSELEARALSRSLQALGLTASCNLRAVPVLLPESRSSS